MTKADLLKYIDERLNQRSDGNIGLLMVRQYVSENMEEMVFRCPSCDELINWDGEARCPKCWAELKRKR